MLNKENIVDQEQELLYKEYEFLRQKFSLTPMSASMWKKARMRPQNAPEVRIRQFARLIHQSEFLFSNLMQAKDIDSMVKLFEPQNSETYDRMSTPPSMGRKSIDILLINTILPYQYAYAMVQQKTEVEESVKVLMEKIPAEDNAIIRQWKMLGQKVESAADTQALLHLFQNYCQPHQCYNCQVGYQIFGQKQLSLF